MSATFLCIRIFVLPSIMFLHTISELIRAFFFRLFFVSLELNGMDLSHLCELIHQVLKNTEELKVHLNYQNQEARFALELWPMETTVMKQVDEIVCNCNQVRRALF